MNKSTGIKLIVQHGSSLQEKISCFGCTSADYPALKTAFQGKEVSVLGYNEHFDISPVPPIVSGSDSIYLLKSEIIIHRENKKNIIFVMKFPDNSEKAKLFADSLKLRNIGGSKVTGVTRRTRHGFL